MWLDTGCSPYRVGFCRSRRHPPGALLRTLVAHQRFACTNQGSQSMTLTELAQSPRPADALMASLATEGDSTVVALRGEADLFTLPALVDVLARVIADHDGPVVIDLAGIAFIETGGIRALSRAAEFLGDRGRELTVRSPSQIAVRILTLLELSHLIEPMKATTP
jgi:anti-sigma B factor antagonist